ncbi:MAG TPA: hypothetical protein VHG27_03670, partial [Xanthobacteraceae bacterium]|nr:hypothetical protein [Xanthobacteraceae bacterium]
DRIVNRPDRLFGVDDEMHRRVQCNPGHYGRLLSVGFGRTTRMRVFRFRGDAEEFGGGRSIRVSGGVPLVLS